MSVVGVLRKPDNMLSPPGMTAFSGRIIFHWHQLYKCICLRTKPRGWVCIAWLDWGIKTIVGWPKVIQCEQCRIPEDNYWIVSSYSSSLRQSKWVHVELTALLEALKSHISTHSYCQQSHKDLLWLTFMNVYVRLLASMEWFCVCPSAYKGASMCTMRGLLCRFVLTVFGL